jgi:acetyl esterase/lipase
VRHRAACLAIVLLAAAPAALAASGQKPEPSGPSVATKAGVARPYGTGAKQVWVLTPTRGVVRSVVVYLHGWGAYLPFEWHQVWMDHLLARGSAVLFPRYQEGSLDDPLISTPWNLEAALRTGFNALDRPGLPVVAAGFSVGGALAFFYAANARAWRVPVPRAVLSVFPIDPGAIDPLRSSAPLHPLPPPDRALRALILVGDRDDVVGRTGADVFWRWLRPVPRGQKEYRVVRTTEHLLANHEAPTDILNPEVRRVFWRPLDTFVTWARTPR